MFFSIVRVTRSFPAPSRIALCLPRGYTWNCLLVDLQLRGRERRSCEECFVKVDHPAGISAPARLTSIYFQVLVFYFLGTTFSGTCKPFRLVGNASRSISLYPSYLLKNVSYTWATTRASYQAVNIEERENAICGLPLSRLN